MTTPPTPHPYPSSYPPPREQTGVRHRPVGDDRPVRLDAKLAWARAWLAARPADHPLASTLRMAVLRRDEMLLDELLEQVSQ